MSTLNVCGSSATNVPNDHNEDRVQCIRLMRSLRSLYVIVEAELDIIIVEAFFQLIDTFDEFLTLTLKVILDQSV